MNMDTKKELLSSKLEKNIPKSIAPSAPAIVPEVKDIQDDYQFSRDTYRDLIRTGVLSLDILAELARDSEHPRAFEVLSQSIKNIGDTTDKLMNLQKMKKELSKTEKHEDARGVTNNNVFVGSTSDLQRMLMNQYHEVDKSIINAENQE